jgi:hypothetical protein
MRQFELLTYNRPMPDVIQTTEPVTEALTETSTESKKEESPSRCCK